jgi:heme oxygenase (biliverdin-IX-beta and delta-forming)
VNAHQTLRAATAADHLAVDSAFAAFDLRRMPSYGRFLVAHARVLPVVEEALAETGIAHRPRWPALLGDLTELGILPPPPIEPLLSSRAGLYGALYVVEGSRLGGALLARSVAPGMPKAYLSAAHERGEWRATLATIDVALRGDLQQIDLAIAGARHVFALYARAAMMVG